MNEHLQRAFIEVCYAVAQCSRDPDATPGDGYGYETRARLIIVLAKLEALLLLSEQAFATSRPASTCVARQP